MSTTAARAEQVMGAAEDLANRIADIHALINQFLEYNSDQAIDWAGTPAPSFLVEDAATGNLQGKSYSRFDIANVIGSFAALRSLITSGVPATGDHLGNINHLARPLG